MKIVSTPFDGVSLVETATFDDERGSFFRAFCARDLSPLLDGRGIVQANVSRTRSRGTVRGMHYQERPHAEMKLVRCLKGKVWDVAVDLRAGSPTFLQSFAAELSAENGIMLVLAEGFAHGFQALAQESELLYLHTACYAPESEKGVRFDDPSLSIAWPLPVTEMSVRDRNHPLITSSFPGVVS